MSGPSRLHVAPVETGHGLADDPGGGIGRRAGVMKWPT